MKPLLVRVALAFFAGLLTRFALVGPAMPAAPETGFPSAVTTDGRFVALAGQGLQTLSEPLRFWVVVPAAEASFTLSVFDGDLGNLWDNHDPRNSTQTQFLLYPDPTKSGDPAGKTAVASATSAAMADSAWTTLHSGAAHLAARAASGNYVYLLVAQWSNPAASANELNAFKVRVTGQVTLSPGQWAFVGAPINLDADPAFGTAGNSYNGQWDWYLFAPPERRQVSLTECDADARTNPTAPGSPPDDNLTPTLPGQRPVLIAPDVRYVVYRPDGQLLLNNPVPSGNTACDTRTLDVPSGGLFHWTWFGVDAHNVIFIRSEDEALPIAVTPLPIAAPTSTSTVTRTATVTPTPSPTSTPTATSTTVATPAPTAIPTLVPTPRPTAVPTPRPSTWGEGSIGIIWPHDGKGVATTIDRAQAVNVGVWPVGEVSCSARPGPLPLYVAMSNEPARLVRADGEWSLRTVGDVTFPTIEYNDVPVEPIVDPATQYRFFAALPGSNVLVHAADQRTLLPLPVVPTEPSARGARNVGEVDARIQVVWPHDEQGRFAPVESAGWVNVAVELFERGTRRSVAADLDVRLLVAEETGLAREVDAAGRSTVAGRRGQTYGVNGQTYVRWLFDDVAVRPGAVSHFVAQVLGASDTATTVWTHAPAGAPSPPLAVPPACRR